MFCPLLTLYIQVTDIFFTEGSVVINVKRLRMYVSLSYAGPCPYNFECMGPYTSVCKCLRSCPSVCEIVGPRPSIYECFDPCPSVCEIVGPGPSVYECLIPVHPYVSMLVPLYPYVSVWVPVHPSLSIWSRSISM